MSTTNVYINSRGVNLEISVVERIARWVGKMLRMFGLGEGESSEIGWGQETSEGENVNVRLHCCMTPSIETNLQAPCRSIAGGDPYALLANVIFLQGWGTKSGHRERGSRPGGYLSAL